MSNDDGDTRGHLLGEVIVWREIRARDLVHERLPL